MSNTYEENVVNPIDLISSWGIPVTNAVSAISAVNNHDVDTGRPSTKALDEEAMLERIRMLTNNEQIDKFDSPKHTKIIYGYVIQESVKRFSSDDPLPSKSQLDEMFSAATEKASALIAKSPWTVKEYVSESSRPTGVDAAGNPKQKSGAKKEQAIALYEANKHLDLTRAEWVTKLMDDVGLTKAGASTYYSNLKNNTYSNDPNKTPTKTTKTKRTVDPTSKKAQAITIWNSLENPDKATFKQAMIDAGFKSTTANTYASSIIKWAASQ